MPVTQQGSPFLAVDTRLDLQYRGKIHNAGGSRGKSYKVLQLVMLVMTEWGCFFSVGFSVVFSVQLYW